MVDSSGVLCCTLLVLMSMALTEGGYLDPRRFPGSYCANRSEPRCCADRDDECTARIKPRHQPYTLCYCDKFCENHREIDCCPDYLSVCKASSPTSAPPSPPPGCRIGDSYMNDCNKCRCVLSRGTSPYTTSYSCETDVCMNDADLISRINTNRYGGWKAGRYNKFQGIKLKDGMRYFLGTVYPKYKVFLQLPVKYLPETRSFFDARRQWPNIQQGAMDQGRCGASWAFSSVGVAADRWAIESGGRFKAKLSVQRLLSCIRPSRDCSGGRLEDAWWFLQTTGTVQDRCYPYTSGVSRSAGTCIDDSRMRCPFGMSPDAQKTTPAYRIANSPVAIMTELQTNGPVQAIIKVRADIFQYSRGVYSHRPETLTARVRVFTSDPFLYHSVKLVGWGVEDGVKYWLAVNSWGADWGDNGTFKIKRGENESEIEQFVVATGARFMTHQRHG